MLLDRPQITETSVIINATVASGTADPANPSVGELFYRTDIGAIRVYTGSGWTEAGAVALAAHIADPALHLSTLQNTLLDGLNLPTLTSANLNFLTGLTQNVQTKFTAIDLVDSTQNSNISTLQSQSTSQNSTLSTHIADTAIHLSSAQNTLLDNLSPSLTSGEVNALVGVTSSVQAQLNSLSSSKYDKTGGTISGNVVIGGLLDMSSNRITGLGTPTNANDAVTKSYVDAIQQGISWKLPVVAATTNNITLTGPQSLDSVAVVAGQRVLVKNQSTPSQNGIYIVSAGAWSRATDSDLNTELENAAVFVQNGLTQADSGWVQTNDASVIGVGFTGSQQWVQFTTVGGVSSSGSGILISGNTISVRAGHGLAFGTPSANDLNISATGNFTFSGSQLDLSNTGVGAATYGSSGQVPAITVDAKGRVTAASNAINISSSNVGSSVIARDGGGNFSAGTMTGNVSGNVTGNLTGTATNASQLGGVAASGYALLTGATFTGDITTYRSGSPTTGVIYLGANSGTRYLYYDGSQYFLNGANLQINSSLALTAANYNSYAPTLTGGNASGTWGINVTGSSGSTTLAAKASTLAQSGGNGAAMTFNWAGQGGQPTWLWGGNDGVNHYVYNPSNFSVNFATSATTATNVQGYVPSAPAAGSTLVLRDSSGYINNTYFNSSDNAVGSGVTAVMVKQGDNYLRSGTAQAIASFISGTSMNIAGTATSTGIVTGPAPILYTTSVSTSYSTAVQMREAGGNGAQGGSMAAAPRLAFHWAGQVASSIAMEPNGTIAIYDNPGTGYEKFRAGATTVSTLNGFTPTDSIVGSRLVATDGNGYIFGNYINMTDEGVSGSNGTVSGIITKRGDNYYRSTSAGSVAAYVGPSITSLGTISTIAGYSPPNGAIRLTPNLHLNPNAGFAVIASWDNGNGGNSANQAFRVGNGSGADALYVTYAGTVVATGNITAFSDRRLKADIEPIHNALEKVSKLNGVTFKRIDTGTFGMGLIAQEVQKVAPETVETDKDGMLSVAYGNLVGLLVEAIKELKAEIAALKADK